MNDERLWNKIGRYLAGELSKAEEQRFEARMESDPELRESVSTLRALWDSNYNQKDGDTDWAWHRMEMELDKRQEENISKTPTVYWLRRSWKYGAIAASIAVAILIALFMFNKTPSQNTIPYLDTNEARIEYTTMKGQREQRILPDGTTVYLNADSRVIVPEGFLEDQRFVYLQGEAYFEAIDHEKLPFMVYAAGFVTIAKQKTAFNVRAFPEQEEVILSVKEGKPHVTKVKTTDEKAPDTLPLIKLRLAKTMKSSEAIAFNKESKSFEPVKEKNTKAYFGWKEGILYFSKSKPAALVKKIERWYGVDITYNACAFRKKPVFSGEFHRAELKEVLANISKNMNVEFSVDEKNIFMMEKC